jgi:endonuclease YncB( thermonuclease family)
VNAWLVEQGYAQVMTVPPNVKLQEWFQEAREAKRAFVGVKGLYAALPPAS